MAERRKSRATLQVEIIAHLKDLPTQLLALESAMEEFGADFDLAQFKRAFERRPNIKAYNNVQAVERAFDRAAFGELDDVVLHPR